MIIQGLIVVLSLVGLGTAGWLLRWAPQYGGVRVPEVPANVLVPDLPGVVEWSITPTHDPMGLT